MFTSVSLEVSDEFVQSILHMHVSNFTPDFVVIVEDCFLLLDCSLFIRENVTENK